MQVFGRSNHVVYRKIVKKIKFYKMYYKREKIGKNVLILIIAKGVTEIEKEKP